MRRAFWTLRIGYCRVSWYLVVHKFPPLQDAAASQIVTAGRLPCYGHWGRRRTLPHAGRTAAVNARLRSQLRLCSRVTALRTDSDQCRDTPRIVVALTSDPVAVACAWRTASRICKPQKLLSTINVAVNVPFTKLRRVTTTGVFGLPDDGCRRSSIASVERLGPEV
jgi:hypothetical protein